MWSHVFRCNSSVSARAFLRSSVILMISFSNARGFRRAVPSQCGIAARSDVDDFVGIGVISDAVREQQIGGVEVVGGVNVPMRENRVVTAHRSTLPARASDTPGRVTHSRARLRWAGIGRSGLEHPSPPPRNLPQLREAGRELGWRPQAVLWLRQRNQLEDEVF